MTRRRIRLWLLLLLAWWLGLMAGRVTMELDLGWWDTVVLALLAAGTAWVAWACRQTDDREESA